MFPPSCHELKADVLKRAYRFGISWAILTQEQSSRNEFLVAEASRLAAAQNVPLRPEMKTGSPNATLFMSALYPWAARPTIQINDQSAT
jgi:hypothetical protein